MSYFITNARNNYLSSSTWRCEFSLGLRGFSKNGALLFRTSSEASAYIKGMLFYLESWINIDIQEQAQAWAVGEKRANFLADSFKTYAKNKKKINALKIVNNFN